MIFISCKHEVVVMESKHNESMFFFYSYMENMNTLSIQQWKLSKYMYAECLNVLCFIN